MANSSYLDCSENRKKTLNCPRFPYNVFFMNSIFPWLPVKILMLKNSIHDYSAVHTAQSSFWHIRCSSGSCFLFLSCLQNATSKIKNTASVGRSGGPDYTTDTDFGYWWKQKNYMFFPFFRHFLLYWNLLELQIWNINDFLTFFC